MVIKREDSKMLLAILNWECLADKTILISIDNPSFGVNKVHIIIPLKLFMLSRFRLICMKIIVGYESFFELFVIIR